MANLVESDKSIEPAEPNSPDVEGHQKPQRRFYLSPSHSRQNSIAKDPTPGASSPPHQTQQTSPTPATPTRGVPYAESQNPSKLVGASSLDERPRTPKRSTPSRIPLSPGLQRFKTTAGSSDAATTDRSIQKHQESVKHSRIPQAPRSPSTPGSTHRRTSSNITSVPSSASDSTISPSPHKENTTDASHVQRNGDCRATEQLSDIFASDRTAAAVAVTENMDKKAAQGALPLPGSQDASKEESFVHISDAPTVQLKEHDVDVPTSNGRPSTPSQSSEKTLAHSAEVQADMTFAEAVKEGERRDDPEESGEPQERQMPRYARSEDSYPELDEMSLDELHQEPSPKHRPYGKIRWAPFNVPAKRRLQTLAVLMHCLSIIGLVSIFFGLCANPFAWPLLLIYLMHVLGSKVATDGSLRYRSEWFRSSYIWHLFAEYFPARLHKTHDLPPTRKYIFGYHPHGIISHGAWAAFATDALGFSEKFPGITNSLLTLDSNFRIPIYRDYVLAMGVRSVSRESIVNILTRGGPNNEGMGRGVTIVVGGARESLEAQPGQLRLILEERKGFIKIAIRTGADLVPVLAFGENDLYDQLRPKEHPYVHKIQMFVLKVWKFTLPFLHGRGIFNYDVGLMPYRHPLNVVVGAPIKVYQSSQVDDVEVDRLHDLYVAEVQKLWDHYKDEFAKDRKEEMQILR